MALIHSKANTIARLRSAYNQLHQNNDLSVGEPGDRVNASEILPDMSRFNFGDIEGNNGLDFQMDSHETSSIFSESSQISPTPDTDSNLTEAQGNKTTANPENSGAMNDSSLDPVRSARSSNRESKHENGNNAREGEAEAMNLRSERVPSKLSSNDDDDDDDDDDDEEDDYDEVEDEGEDEDEIEDDGDVREVEFEGQNGSTGLNVESRIDSHNSSSSDQDSEIDYPLNMEDDSDFEEDFLRAAQQINFGDRPGLSDLVAPGAPRNRKSTGSNSTSTKLRQSRSLSTLSANNTEIDSKQLAQAKPKLGLSAPSSLEFSKHAPPESATSGNSLLTSKLRGPSGSGVDPRNQYIEAIATTELPPVTVKIFLPGNISLTIRVRHNCSVHLAIGYALSCDSATPIGQTVDLPDWADANHWNLRLAEDDGTPDEDFPALDRSRLIASYQVDDFALVLASPEEFQENAQRTPNKISFTSNATSPSGNPGTTSPPTARSGVIHVRIFSYPFDPLLSDVYWEETVLYRLTPLSVIFERLCREKMLDPDMYVLRTVDDSHQIVPLNQSITFNSEANNASSGGNGSAMPALAAEFELTPKRSLVALGKSTSVNDLNGVARKQSVTRSGSAPTISNELTNGNRERRRNRARLGKTSISYTADKKTPQGPMLPMQPLGFYKYRIWRRQQMSFKGRHERELVIDGESIHIMPSSESTVLETPKTTSFHIRQVMRVKQSHKIPTNFKIMVMKHSGPKRYDLEGISSNETAEIVAKINQLRTKH